MRGVELGVPAGRAGAREDDPRRPQCPCRPTAGRRAERTRPLTAAAAARHRPRRAASAPPLGRGRCLQARARATPPRTRTGTPRLPDMRARRGVERARGEQRRGGDGAVAGGAREQIALLDQVEEVARAPGRGARVRLARWASPRISMSASAAAPMGGPVPMDELVELAGAFRVIRHVPACLTPARTAVGRRRWAGRRRHAAKLPARRHGLTSRSTWELAARGRATGGALGSCGE